MEPTMENQAGDSRDFAETRRTNSASEQQGYRAPAARETSSWLTLRLGMLLLAVGLIAYTYSTGQLQQAADKLGATIAAYIPQVSGALGVAKTASAQPACAKDPVLASANGGADTPSPTPPVPVPYAANVANVANAPGATDNLVLAREAFAAGDMNAAIAGYRAQLAASPDDMEARGELGNVFFAVGALQEAAQTYFETASLAIGKNRPEVAEALLPIVGAGNPMLAEQLGARLFEARMRADMPRSFEGAPQRPAWQFDQPG